MLLIKSILQSLKQITSSALQVNFGSRTLHKQHKSTRYTYLKHKYDISLMYVSKFVLCGLLQKFRYCIGSFAGVVYMLLVISIHIQRLGLYYLLIATRFLYISNSKKRLFGLVFFIPIPCKFLKFSWNNAHTNGVKENV